MTYLTTDSMWPDYWPSLKINDMRNTYWDVQKEKKIFYNQTNECFKIGKPKKERPGEILQIWKGGKLFAFSWWACNLKYYEWILKTYIYKPF